MCSTCKINKSLDNYTFRKDRNKYYTVCDDCRILQRKQWAINNRDKLNNAAIKWKQNNPNNYVAQYRKYQAKLSTKIREQNWYILNKVKILNNCKIWYQNNKHISFANSAKRRAAKLQRTPNWLSDLQLKQIQAIYLLSSTVSKLTKVKHHVDHIVPLQGETVSGLHVPWNLRITTADINFKKSNKLIVL